MLLDTSVVQVHLSANAGEDWSESAATFTYASTLPRVVTLEPSLGSVMGGSLVTIRGWNFLPSTRLTCRFRDDEDVRDATWISETSIRCETPMGRNVGEVNVRVSNNGVDFSEENVLFEFHSDVNILSVQPSFGCHKRRYACDHQRRKTFE